MYGYFLSSLIILCLLLNLLFQVVVLEILVLDLPAGQPPFDASFW